MKRIGQEKDRAWVEITFKMCHYVPNSKKRKKGAKAKALKLLSSWVAW